MEAPRVQYATTSDGISIAYVDYEGGPGVPAVALQRAFAAFGQSDNRALGQRAAGEAPPVEAAGFNPQLGPNPEALRIRVGINAGEPIAEDDDLFGSSVILAARTASQAQGGEVLVTDVVRQLVAGKGFVFSDRGEVALRGFEDPVRLYELRWAEAGDGQ